MKTGLLTVLVLFGLTSLGSAQTIKAGYVDSDKIFAEFSEWAKADEEFQTEYRAWDEQAQDLQNELQDLQDEYERQRLILSDEKKKEREAAIEAKRQALDAYTNRIFGPGGEAEKKQAALVKPLLDKINSAIEQVATEGNYDFIFTAGGLAYGKKEYDITDKVLEILEE
jgi:outer membrane protein